MEIFLLQKLILYLQAFQAGMESLVGQTKWW